MVAFLRAGTLVGLGPPRQLRRDGDRGDLIRLHGVEREALQADPRVLACTPMGAAWHVKLTDPAHAEPLGRDLGVAVERIAPTLEDVFLDACEFATEQGGKR